MSERPAIVTTIRTRTNALDIDLVSMWQFRDLLLALAWRDIRLRYSQTALGVSWVLLQPLLGSFIFTLVFSLIARVPSGGVPYFFISYAGLVSWNLFGSAITRISGSLLANSSLISKVYFPRLILPLGAVPAALLDFALGIFLLCVLAPLWGLPVGWGLLLLPLCVFILCAVAIGIGVGAAALSVSYRDVQHIIPLLVQLMMYASPVGYSVSVVPEQYRSWYMLNPLAAPIDYIRWSFTGVGSGNPHDLIYSFIASVVILLAGLLIFRARERKFADVI
jgi:lipopolysaccharide transport system permease protein